MKNILLRLDDDIVAHIDQERGLISRTAYIRNMILGRTRALPKPIRDEKIDSEPITIGSTQGVRVLHEPARQPINELQQAIQDSGLQAVLDDRTPDYELEEGQPNEATRYQISRQVKLATDVREVWRIATKYKIKPQ